MSEIWIPNGEPPQVTEEARLATINLLIKEGPVISKNLVENLHESHEPLWDYLDRLGEKFNQISEEDLWPKRVLKLGAAITMKAYSFSGYYQSVDEDAFNVAYLAAQLDGIPDTYISSLHFDLELVDLISASKEMPVFNQSTILDPALESGGYQQVLDIGAGCTRHYLQHSLAA